MKAYSIFSESEWGYESKRAYTSNYSKAVIEFNNLLRKTMKEVYDTINKEDFSEEVASFKEYDIKGNNLSQPKNIELICRKCPFILYKEDNKLIARVYSWEKPSYEYGEQDIISEKVILEEIELI